MDTTLPRFPMENIQTFQLTVSIREIKVPPIFQIDPSALLPSQLLEAILKLEELELKLKQSIPSNYPHENNESCFFTAKTREIYGNITILTGELEPHLLPPNASEGLKTNLEIAKKINAYVNDSVPFSVNFLQRSRIFSKDYYDGRYVKFIEKVSELVRSEFKHLNPTQRVKRILEYKTGRCYELSLVGSFQGKAIMHVSIVNGDHNFLIIGSNIQNLSNIGKNLDLNAIDPNAVVADFWTGSNYPACMIKDYLFDYKRRVEYDGMLYTKVKKFNPSKQSLFAGLYFT